jgi:membrane associated rhomboid family serine protease
VRLSRDKRSAIGRPWSQKRRLVLLTLVGVSAGAFGFQLFLDAAQPGFVREYLALSNRGLLDAYSWQFITAPLLHANPWHFLGNILLLYFLGRDIESILGQRHFFYLFLTGAFGGELGHLFLMPAQTALSGASGGIAAVLSAYATILPELELVTWRSRLFTVRVKAKHFAFAVMFLSVVMLVIDRHGTLTHSAIPGGLIAGWLYVHLLGFGHPSWFERKLWQRRAMTRRIERMTFDEFVEIEVDPLLDKISRNGIASLSRAERRILARVCEKNC